MPHSTYYAVLLALVLGVGCGKKEEKAAPKSQSKTDTTPKIESKAKVTPKAEPKAEAKKPLTKEESAKVVEAAIRKAARKPTGELTKADLEKVTELYLEVKQLTDVPKGLEKLTQLTKLNLYSNQLTDVKGLEKLTQLTHLYLHRNQLTDVKALEKLTQLKYLILHNNPDLTKAQIAELQKALPNCKIISNPTK